MLLFGVNYRKSYIKDDKSKNGILFNWMCKKKANIKCKAVNMYKSTLFKYELLYALKHTNKENIFILSAKYGLLKLNDIISPYNETLNNKSERDKIIWSNKVVNQLKENGLNLQKDTFIFLCGENYKKYLKKSLRNYIEPCKGLSLGFTLQFYKKYLERKGD